MSKTALFTIEFVDLRDPGDKRLCIIHEVHSPTPRISLTNSVETVIEQVKREDNPPAECIFVQHNLYGEYDIVTIENGRPKWKALYYPEQEQMEFSNELIIMRLDQLEAGSTQPLVNWIP